MFALLALGVLAVAAVVDGLHTERHELDHDVALRRPLWRRLGGGVCAFVARTWLAVAVLPLAVWAALLVAV